MVGWRLLTGVRNRSIAYLRGRGAQERREQDLEPVASMVGAHSDPWHEVSLKLERDAVREALSSLPAEQRQAVQLAYFGGYSQTEIAAMTRGPLGTVKGRMRLALQTLHPHLRGRDLVEGCARKALESR